MTKAFTSLFPGENGENYTATVGKNGHLLESKCNCPLFTEENDCDHVRKLQRDVLVMVDDESHEVRKDVPLEE